MIWISFCALLLIIYMHLINKSHNFSIDAWLVRWHYSRDFRGNGIRGKGLSWKWSFVEMPLGKWVSGKRVSGMWLQYIVCTRLLLLHSRDIFSWQAPTCHHHQSLYVALTCMLCCPRWEIKFKGFYPRSRLPSRLRRNIVDPEYPRRTRFIGITFSGGIV